MNNKINTGGPAFPCDVFNGKVHIIADGMTLRDYFAAKAMQAWLVGVDDPKIGLCAEKSYAIADAMIEARNA